MGQFLSKTALSSIVVAVASLVVSSQVWASEPAPSHEPLRIAVDTSTLAEADRERIAKVILAGVREQVEAEGIDVVDDGTATTLRVRIEYLDPDDLEYAVYYDIQRGGEIVGDVPWVACTFCVDAKLLRSVTDGLPKALERIAELAEPIGVDEPEPTDEPVDEPNPDRVAVIGPLGIAGAVLAGSGLALTIAGAIELPRGTEVTESDGLVVRAREHRQTGQVLLGTGAGVLVVGVVMLAVDLGLRAKKRKQADASARMLVPVFGRDFTGLGYVQRF